MRPGLWFDPEPIRPTRERLQSIRRRAASNQATPTELEDLWHSLEPRAVVASRITSATVAVSIVGGFALMMIVKVLWP